MKSPLVWGNILCERAHTVPTITLMRSAAKVMCTFTCTSLLFSEDNSL